MRTCNWLDLEILEFQKSSNPKLCESKGRKKLCSNLDLERLGSNTITQYEAIQSLDDYI